MVCGLLQLQHFKPPVIINEDDLLFGFLNLGLFFVVKVLSGLLKLFNDSIASII